MISGNLYAGAEVDVWSCGVILYALLCGTLPFDDESIPNLFKKIKAGMYSLPSHLSQLSRDLILRMLVVDPMKRITIADIRAHPWFQHKLPSYLALPPEAIEGQERFVDDEILVKVCELPLGAGGFPVSESAVVDAIAMKHAPEFNRALHDIRVAYELLLDAKRHKLRIADVVLAQQDLSRTPPTGSSKLLERVGSHGSNSSSSREHSTASSPLASSSILNALGAGPKIRSSSSGSGAIGGVGVPPPSSGAATAAVAGVPGVTADNSSRKRRYISSSIYIFFNCFYLLIRYIYVSIH